MGELSSYPPVTTLAGTERIPVITTPGVAGGNKYITADNLALFTGGGGAGTPAEILAALLTVDGPGSTLNADFLDGLSSADFELRPENVLRLRDYGAVGDGVADDSVAIRNWCLAAVALNPTPTDPVGMYASAGTYKTTLTGVTRDLFEWTNEATIGIAPSNAYIYGDPNRTWFYQTEVPAEDGEPEVDEDSYHIFGVKNGSSNILFEHLSFRGENTGPFLHVLNNNASGIDIMLSTSHDVTVKNCNFRDMYGHTVHARGDDENIHVIDCWFYQCANGINVNSNGTIQRGNIMEKCEGIECSGARALISNNLIIDALDVGIGLGGAGDYRYGVVCSNNVIDGCDAAGIRIGDGCFGTIVDGNVVRKSTNQGISFGEAFEGWGPDHCIISNNVFVDNGLISAGPGVGMDIDFNNHTVTGNTCYNTGDDVLYSQDFACEVRGDNCFLDGNSLDGAVRDLTIIDTAANIRLGQNFLATNTVYWAPGGTSSLAIDTGWFKATTDTIREYRLSGDGSTPGRGRFAEFADGKLEWGDNTAARDTNLYRAAANVLKTDDSFKTGASTTGSRPSAATAGAGAIWFDTTLNRLIISDGTNWLAYLAATGPSTGWAVSNVTTDKVFDANATSIDELADSLGTLITYLISIGVLAA